MTTYIANTDRRWFDFLSHCEGLEEVNFWTPGGVQSFKRMREGEPLIFKLKKNEGNVIAGFGMFVGYVGLTVREAWDYFGRGNGADSMQHMWELVRQYRKDKSALPLGQHYRIGCILLAGPVFFPESMWIHPPLDWSGPIVQGKTYDTSHGEGKRIWQACLEASLNLAVPEAVVHNLTVMEQRERFGREILITPRLGQGTFRFAVQNAYRKCAVTGEHTLPALEAAHIVPYSTGGVHEVPNGLLLRADIHALYDRGYVTVTPDKRFRVSPRLDAEYQNGKIYYQLENSLIWTPEDPRLAPKPENLEYHASEVFLG